MDINSAFKIVSHKGPVRHQGPQRTYLRAMVTLEPYLLAEEKHALFITHGHAHAECQGEGRQEWDEICSQIAIRLNIEYPLKNKVG